MALFNLPAYLNSLQHTIAKKSNITITQQKTTITATQNVITVGTQTYTIPENAAEVRSSFDYEHRVKNMILNAEFLDRLGQCLKLE